MNNDSEPGRGPQRGQLAEVWGDTTDTRHLAWAIALGIGISLPAFLVASRVLANFVSSPELAKAYAMLAGLAGCIVAGVLCAVLFKPKRVVVEGHAADPAWRHEVLAQLAEESGGLGAVADLPDAVVQEMKELQIYDLFAEYEAAAKPLQSTAGATRRPPFAHASGVAAPQIKEA